VLGKEKFMRTVVPQVAGVYESNNDSYSYTHMLLPTSNPCEWYAVDAFPCDRSGEILEGYECPIPFTASDFGDCIFILAQDAREF
jgi:hypothetical protein